MPIDSEAPKPKAKYSPAYFDRLYRMNIRLMALGLLREKYQLSLHECQGVAPEVVRERQARYDEHLEKLKEIWRKEDEEIESSS